MQPLPAQTSINMISKTEQIRRYRLRIRRGSGPFLTLLQNVSGNLSTNHGVARKKKKRLPSAAGVRRGANRPLTGLGETPVHFSCPCAKSRASGSSRERSICACPDSLVTLARNVQECAAHEAGFAFKPRPSKVFQRDKPRRRTALDVIPSLFLIDLEYARAEMRRT